MAKTEQHNNEDDKHIDESLYSRQLYMVELEMDH